MSLIARVSREWRSLNNYALPSWGLVKRVERGLGKEEWGEGLVKRVERGLGKEEWGEGLVKRTGQIEDSWERARYDSLYQFLNW